MKPTRRTTTHCLTSCFATALVLWTGLATGAPIDVREIFQLEGDAFDTQPTSGVSLVADPADSPDLQGAGIDTNGEGNLDGQGEHDDQDDWAKFKNSVPPGDPKLDGLPNGVDFVNGGTCVNPAGGAAPESCGHVGGPDDASQPDVGESPDPLASKDGHTGGNSFRHLYNRDKNQLTDGPNTDDGFVQGTSLDQDICEWRHELHNNPSKDDIENALGAFYKASNLSKPKAGGGFEDDFFFFGAASLQAPNGSAKVGYWLLQANLIAVPTGLPASDPRQPFGGRFMPANFDFVTDPDPCVGTNTSGGRNELHVPGDILFANDFENGGDTVVVKIFEWQRSNLALDGELVDVTGAVSANCQNAAAPSLVCATANALAGNGVKDTESPDTYLY